MAEAVVSFAVERLGDLLISEAKFLYGVKDKVLEIQSLLKEMQNFLKDADKKRGNQDIGKWVAEIRELALQTEDVLETHAIGSEIGTIQAKITNLATSRPTLGIQALDDHRVESSKVEDERKRQLRITYAHSIERDFVGMEEEIKELVLHLKNKDRGYEAVSVWGMGGQGKTTLAKKVYNHIDVRSYFQAFAWVCITQNLKRQKILQDILQGLLPTKSEGEIREMGDTKLVELLYKTQKEFKCLVVIDDIWSLNDWEMLKQAFSVEEMSGSKILLTTRNEAVANTGFPYKLRPLSEDEGWKLLLQKAFPRRDDAAEIKVEPKKEKLGRDMVQQCQGLPLAISALGGLLKNKKSSKEWEMVNKDIASNLSREGDDGVMHILGLSYDDLPFRLKQLFLYLGTFKEDEEIEVGELYLLWIAEGMIPSVQKAKGEMLMDVAERYLVELAQRSLIQLEPMDKRCLDFSSVPWLNVRSCRLHDLIRDICLSKVKEEDILKIIDFRNSHNDQGMELTRRLAIYNANKVNDIALEQQYMVGQIRSLLYYNAFVYTEKVYSLKDFKLVRVLKLYGFKFKRRKLVREIAKLIHLRYLSLVGCELKELPSCIGDLRYLETLDLRVDGDLFIPNVLWKIKRLKHLYLPYTIRGVNKKLRFDGLKELELLQYFDASKCDANDLMKLTNLQVLIDAMTCSLEEQKGVMNFVNSDWHHPRYTSLKIGLFDHNNLIQLLECDNLNQLTISGDNYMIPDHLYEQPRLSQSLTRIKLYNCHFEADAVVLVEKLPNLQRLELYDNCFAGNEFVCSANSFPQLVYLKLWDVEELEKWRVDEGAMPNLSTVEIGACKRLEMLPEGLKFLTSLGELTISQMPKAFNDRVRVIEGVEGQDFHKVRHIPSIVIQYELR